MDIKEAAKIADGIRKKISEVKFEKAGKLTCSIGLTELKNGDDSKTVFDRVDKAMYEAKNNGRNCVVVK